MVRQSSGVVNRHIAMCIAKGVMKAVNPMKLMENGGNIEITESWARSLLSRMGFSKRNATTGKLELPSEFVEEKSFTFLNEIGAHVKNDDLSIPWSMILNWDQTPLNYIPSSRWTMAEQGASKVPIAGQADKRSLTALVTVSAAGDFLPFQLIYPGKTAKSLPKCKFPEGFSVTQNANHWSTEDTMLRYISDILEPYLAKQRELVGEATPALLIYDAFKGHTTEAVQQRLRDLNAKLVMVPKNMTDHLQPIDISVNKPIKNYLQKRFQEWYTQQVTELELSGERSYEAVADLLKSSVTLRELGARWICDLYEHFQAAPQRLIIQNGFRHCGIEGICQTGPIHDDPFV